MHAMMATTPHRNEVPYGTSMIRSQTLDPVVSSYDMYGLRLRIRVQMS